jgi:transposase
MKEVILRAFGARLIGGQEAEKLATDVFLAQNRLWNKLVEIERDHRAQYRRALEEGDAELGRLTSKAQAEEQALEELIAARNRARSAARSRKYEGAETHALGINGTSASLKELRIRMKACKERAKAAAKPATEAAEALRREKVKEAAQAASLWWCHGETVLAKYDIARVRAMKAGKELRFHRFDGNGSMGVRFTLSGGMLDKVMAGTTDLLRFREPTAAELGRMQAIKSDGGRRVVIRLRAGSKIEGSIPALEFITTMHAGMELPRDIPLKTVIAKRTMHVKKPEWKLVLMFSHEVDEQPQLDMPAKAAGIDFGWRLTNVDGERRLRVAAISFGRDEKVRYVELDDQWLRRMERADRLRGELDDSANKFAGQILPHIAENRLAGIADDEWFRVLAGKARRAKRAYASLLIDLCDAHAKAGSPLGEEVAPLMDEWRRSALSLAVEAHHCKARAIGHRKHIFRNVAAALVKEAGLLGIENIDLRGMALLMKPDGTDNRLAQTARKFRTWAAPSELRLAIEQAAQRDRRETIRVDAKGTTTICSACGHENPGPIEDLVFVCQGCGKVWDQDENAGHNCRNRAMDEADISDVAVG